jgi:hypothetical protein
MDIAHLPISLYNWVEETRDHSNKDYGPSTNFAPPTESWQNHGTYQ